MAGLMRRDSFDVLEPFRRLMEGDLQTAWPRVEEFQNGNTMVIRVKLPGIGPGKDVELTRVNDTLHLRATRQQKSEHKDSYRPEFHYDSFPCQTTPRTRTSPRPLPTGCSRSARPSASRPRSSRPGRSQSPAPRMPHE